LNFRATNKTSPINVATLTQGVQQDRNGYVFDGTFTGHAFADFLLGLPHFTGYILPAPDVNPFSTYYAVFAQDSWRPSRQVTIDLGVRYDVRPPMRDRSNQLGNFDPFQTRT
jgi:outer membrane receptor protein involved in Fe transport